MMIKTIAFLSAFTPSTVMAAEMVPRGPIVDLGMITAPGEFTAQSQEESPVLSGVQTLQITLDNAREFCPNRLPNSIENCWFLMTVVSPDSTCTCHNFCSGQFVGCGGTWQGNADCPGGNGMAYVAGCTFADLQGLVGVQPDPAPGGPQPVVPQPVPALPVPQPVAPMPLPVAALPVAPVPLPVAALPVPQPVPAPVIQCLTCPPNASRTVQCVQDLSTECVCNPGFQFVPDQGCVLPQPTPQCLSCPQNAESNEACVTDINAQCFCSMGFVFSAGFCVPATPQCITCPVNSNPLTGCVTDITTQCVCIPGFVISNGACIQQVAAPSIECQACPANLQPVAGVTCVTDAVAQCECGPGRVFVGTMCFPSPVPRPVPVPQPIAVPEPFPTFPPRGVAVPVASRENLPQPIPVPQAVPTFPPRGVAAPVANLVENNVPAPVSQVLSLPTYPPRGTAVNLADNGGGTTPDFIFGGGSSSSGKGKGGKGKGGKGKGGKGKGGSSEKESIEFGLHSASRTSFGMGSTLLFGIMAFLAMTF